MVRLAKPSTMVHAARREPITSECGDVRPVATGGASVGIWSGLVLEGQVTLGGDEVERGWGLGARVTF